MALLDLNRLQADVLRAERRLQDVECIYGKQSDEYKGALSRFSKIWHVMKMRRKPEEFVWELVRT